MRLDFIKCHGSGNDFPLIDARQLTLDDSAWAGIARALADRDGPVGGDGLLLLAPGRDGAAFAMRMFNADGSEAETCLNGLRCVARLGFEVLGRDAALVSLKSTMAEAAREPALAPGVVTIRERVESVSTRTADVGLRIDAAEVIDAPIPGLPSDRAFTAVAMPNPHLVTFVDKVDDAELVALGDWCEAAPALIPGRANVSFVEVRDGGNLFVRTFERGVGLTNSCGSAMAASTFAAGLTGRVPFGKPLEVFNRGGLVRATAIAPQDGASVTLSGNATFLYDASVTVDPVAGTAEVPVIHARRFDEVAAWQAVLDRLG
jgi:diaminopimelate epimerase